MPNVLSFSMICNIHFKTGNFLYNTQINVLHFICFVLLREMQRAVESLCPRGGWPGVQETQDHGLSTLQKGLSGIT